MTFQNSMTDLDFNDMPSAMRIIGKRARQAARQIAQTPSQKKKATLIAMAQAVRDRSDVILAANAQDLEAAKDKSLKASFLDRLTLTQDRIQAIANGLTDIAELDDPVGAVIATWDRPNGLNIERVRTPLGVIGVIYESRPNVTADAGALCFMAGNGVILRGGSEGVRSSKAIHDCMLMGLRAEELPTDAIQLIPTQDRAAVGQLLSGLDGAIDVIVPRGGKNLVSRVQSEARIPVFAHLEGIVHLFVDKSANLEMAVDIVNNAKLRRTGICGSLETLLIHQDVAASHLPDILAKLSDGGCEIRGDQATQSVFAATKAATLEDWGTEYLDKIVSVKVVTSLDEAIAHIGQYGSQHTDGIITEDQAAADQFFAQVDSAIVLHNASTQFADGGEFGMGAEVGIATGRMHARGPIGVEQLTSFNYRVRGAGQTRPT